MEKTFKLKDFLSGKCEPDDFYEDEEYLCDFPEVVIQGDQEEMKDKNGEEKGEEKEENNQEQENTDGKALKK